MQNSYSRESRFSNRVLEAYARAGLPETFTVRAAANDPTEILLYSEIGPWGVTAKDFVRVLAQVGDVPITLRINSPGGDVFDGYAIYNALKARSAPVNVVIDGIAASAASFIAMAGDTIESHEASMWMIHKSWGLAVGNADDMTDTAAVLNKIDGQLADIYAARTGKSAPEMMALMEAETWLTSSEAVASGFATGIVSAANDNHTDHAAFAKAEQAKRIVAALRAALPDYDPDGDGDNDAQEALTLITAAMDMLGDAAAALSGTDDDAEGGEDDATPGMMIAHAQAAAPDDNTPVDA
jgi:ATP-dependent Clp protease protease subunit